MCPSSFSVIGSLFPALTRPSVPFVTCDTLAAIRGVADAALALGLVVGLIAGWLVHKLVRRLRAASLVGLQRRRAHRAEAVRLAIAYHRRRLAALEFHHAD